jgi:hypothetical protein
VLATALLASAPASGEPTAGEIAVARQLFAEATAFEHAQRWREAEAKLREAIAIKETPGLRFHLALCQEKQGMLVEALVDYDRAGELIRKGTRAPDVASLLGPARAALEQRVARLAISVSGAEAPVVELDGTRLAPTVVGRAMPVNPGAHTIVVSAPGRTTFSQQVTLTEGEQRSLAATLHPTGAAAAPAAGTAPAARTAPAAAAPPGPRAARPVANGARVPEPPRERRPSVAPPSTDSLRVPVILALGGASLVALGVGVGFTIARDNDEEDAADLQIELDRQQQSCASPSAGSAALCQALDESIADLHAHETAAIAGYAVAGAGAAATLATALLWPAPARKQSGPRAARGPWIGVERDRAAWRAVVGASW